MHVKTYSSYYFYWIKLNAIFHRFYIGLYDIDIVAA